MAAAYRLFVPGQSVGASLVYFDLFNANGSASYLDLVSVQPIVDNSVAVTGVVGVTLFLTRTTAVGTTGTAATREGTSLTAATFSAMDNSQSLNASITARLTPGGGATAGAVLSFASLFTEETNAGSYVPCPDLAKPNLDGSPGIIIPENSGIRVVQSSVASVGVVGFNIVFKVNQK